jgi:AraC-like DNA-binding protein
VTPASGDIAGGLGVGTARIIPYHLLTEGECVVTLDGHRPLQLTAGDVALFPNGDVHTLASDPGAAPTSLPRAFVDNVLARRSILPIRHGGGGRRTRLLCGFFAIERWGGDHVVSGLPAVLTARVGAGAGRDLLAAVARRSIEAHVAGGDGSDALVCKLSEILFVDALRHFVASGAVPLRGWLAGLRDPAIHRALTLIHARPQQAWDVSALAAACASSRSKFLARFTSVVGTPPIKYLAQWRMILAARDLSDGDIAVMQVADRYGYGSEAAFTRAFRKIFDVAPAAFRRAQRQPDGVETT